MDEPADREANRRRGRARVPHERNDGQAATSAQLRDEMPSARTIGRSSARDPAAAPMDTDDEAAGHTPRSHAIEHELAALAAGDQARGAVAGASKKPDYTRDAAALSQSWATLLVVLMLVLGCVALWLAMR